MKSNAAFYAVTAFLAIPLALAAVPTKDNGFMLNVEIPDKYIVKYKPNIDLDTRRKHEEDINNKAKQDKKRGVVDTFDMLGMQGYIVEMGFSSFENVTEGGLVRACLPQRICAC